MLMRENVNNDIRTRMWPHTTVKSCEGDDDKLRGGCKTKSEGLK